MSVNKVILIGNLCKDVELRFMQNGEAVGNTSLATNEKWKNKEGEKQEKAEFHNLVFYRRLAEIAGEYLKKGSQIYIEGKLQTRKWEKDGVTRYSTEIIVNEMQMLGSKQEQSADSGAPASSRQEPSTAEAPASKPSAFDNFDNDIPFFEPCRHGGIWRVM